MNKEIKKIKRFYWEKFLTGKNNYNVFFLLETIAYIVDSGTLVDEWVCRWDKDGVNRSMFGYSHNNEPYASIILPLDSMELHNLVNYILMQFIVRTKLPKVEEFKQKELRFNNKNSFLNIPHSHVPYDFKLWELDGYENKKMNITPIYMTAHYGNIFCKKVSLEIGTGMHVKYSYQIGKKSNDGCWDEYIEKNKNEGLNEYLNRSLIFMDKITS